MNKKFAPCILLAFLTIPGLALYAKGVGWLASEAKDVDMFYSYGCGFLGAAFVVAFIYTIVVCADVARRLETRAIVQKEKNQRYKELQDLYESNDKEQVFNFGAVDYEAF